MVYQGSKARLLGGVLPYIQECINANGIRQYVEPFVGGANVIDSVKCPCRVGCDANGELIALLRYMRDNPGMEAAPKSVPFELYAKVREARNTHSREYSVPYTAMVGYFASYGGRYFDGGYGRDNKGGRSMYEERLRNARKQAPALKGIQFCSQGYAQTLTSSRLYTCLSFVYCDPPYRGTQQYAVGGGFDYDDYYGKLLALKDYAYILCSEYAMPEDDFVCVWEKDRKVLQKSDRTEGEVSTERLYTPRGGLYHKWWEDNYEADREGLHKRQGDWVCELP